MDNDEKLEAILLEQNGILWRTQREKEWVIKEVEKLKEFSNEKILQFCDSKKKNLPRLAKVEAKRRGLI